MPASSPVDPQATRILASTSTLHDVFPKTTVFELQGGQRPFAIVTREPPAQGVEQSSLIVVTGDGVVHEFLSKGGEFLKPADPPYVIEELRGGAVIRVTGVSVTGTTYVVITGQKSEAAGKEAVVAALARTVEGWKRMVLPIDAAATQAVAHAAAAGFVLPAKEPVYYAFTRKEGAPGSSVVAFTFGAGGAVTLTAFGEMPGFTDAFRLVALETKGDSGLHLVSVGPNLLFLHPPRAGEGPITFEEHAARAYTMAGMAGPIDGSYLTPVNDERGQCHGIFVRTFENELYATSFSDRDLLPITGREGGPARVTDITYSFYGEGNLHVFALDALGSVWYANCPRGTDLADLTWEPTGQRAVNLEAPPVMGERPYVMDGRPDRLDQLAGGDKSEVWTRIQFPVAEPRPEAERTVVHRITLSALDDEGRPDNVLLFVRAERPTIVEHDGLLYQLRPDRTVDFGTNTLGNVALRMRGTGLDTPALLVYSPQIPTLPEQRYQPAASALQRLANEDPSFPVTGKKMQEAHLLPEMSEEDAECVAATFRAAAKATAGNHDASRARGAEPGTIEASVTIVRTSDGFRVDSGGSMAFRSGADADIASEIASSAAAFWNWVRGAWDAIKDFTLHVVEGTAQLIARAADRVLTLVTEAARYIADGVHAVIAFLNRLGEDLVDAGRRFTEWVAELLQWDDIVRCKNVVRDYTLACLSDFETLVGSTLPARVSEAIRSLQKDVDRLFERALGESKLQQATRDPATVKKRQELTLQHGSKMTLLHDALPKERLPDALFELSPELREKIDTLARQAQTFAEGDRLRSHLNALEPIFKGKTTVEQALGIGIHEALRALQPLVKLALDAADVVQTLLFEILAGIIAAFRKLLTTPLAELGAPFRWLDSLYRTVSGGESLTLIDLASLLFVTPGAIAYHILNNRRPVLEPATPVPAMTPTFIAAASSVLFGSTTDAAGADETISHAQSVFKFVEAVTLAVAGTYFLLFRTRFSVIQNIQRISEATTGSSILPGVWDIVNTVVTIVDLVFGLWLVGRWFIALALPFQESIQSILGMTAASIASAVMVAVFILILGIGFRSSLGKARVFLTATVTAANGVLIMWAHLIWTIIWSARFASQATPAENGRFYGSESAVLLFNVTRVLTFGVPLGVMAGEVATKGVLTVLNFVGDEIGYTAAAAATFISLSWEALIRHDSVDAGDRSRSAPDDD